MRCPHCGQSLPKGTLTCQRCNADLSPTRRRKDLLVTLLVALVAIAAIMLLTHLVLDWHDAQMLLD